MPKRSSFHADKLMDSLGNATGLEREELEAELEVRCFLDSCLGI
jgi:hypothetical protein